MFETDAVKTLEVVLKGNIAARLETLPTILHTIGKEMFGMKTTSSATGNTEQGKNRRELKIEKLRLELKKVKRQYKCSLENEKPGLAQIRNELRSELRSLRKAEHDRNKRRRRARARAAFMKGPFNFVKTVLGNPRSGKLESEMVDVEQSLAEAHNDIRADAELDEIERLISPPEPRVQFKLNDITLAEVRYIIRKARTKSAPGYSGTSYKVYKKCDKLLNILWKLLNSAWKKDKIPECWQRAEGCFVPKEEDSRTIKQFRTISLLSVECKIFFAVLSKRLTNFMLDNQYLDTSVQKGGAPGVSGCVEHTSTLTQLIQEACKSKGDLAVVWLDLSNAYGSIPHKVVEETLNRYHVPDKVRCIIKQYYSGFHLRFSYGRGQTKWQRLEKGIITGDTISVILFSSAMNMMVKSAENECKGPVMKSGIRQPPSFHGRLDHCNNPYHPGKMAPNRNRSNSEVGKDEVQCKEVQKYGT